MNEKLEKVLIAIKEKKKIDKEKKDKIIAKYNKKNLTVEERLSRIEELLEIK